MSTRVIFASQRSPPTMAICTRRETWTSRRIAVSRIVGTLELRHIIGHAGVGGLDLQAVGGDGRGRYERHRVADWHMRKGCVGRAGAKLRIEVAKHCLGAARHQQGGRRRRSRRWTREVSRKGGLKRHGRLGHEVRRAVARVEPRIKRVRGGEAISDRGHTGVRVAEEERGGGEHRREM